VEIFRLLHCEFTTQFELMSSDNTLAIKQMQAAYETLLSRKVKTESTSPAKTKTGKIHPRILTLGGDHSIVSHRGMSMLLTCQALPALRALGAIYGPISVVHFDSHLDTYSQFIMS
jgi:agmatinase